MNGTGVITPGNLPANSGTGVSVSPTVTTTYTLTVTPSSGAAVTATTTITVNPAPSITSFVASPTAILAGGSSSLTGVFANGTGVITPGNLAVTSGTPVSVSPGTTTIYTLTVTPPVGTAITQQATVTVYPVPTITSFAASPTSITAGATVNLTANFSNGTGVITPGNILVTSLTQVPVTPTTTTTYTLTVTPPVGAAITQMATVTVVPAPAITSFAASPTTVGPGGSTNLTAVFANGTGLITPGSITVTSGTPVSVSPTATTVYTLQVTNSAGAAVTQMTTVTWSATAPAITSFVPTPATIAAGASSSLLADFVNGTGMITPGNLAVTSGTPVSVSPATTTTYTLTVTPTSGTPVTQTATVTVVPPPTITSFGASPATITSGTSSSLTAVFAGGTGVIMPGSLNVTSGTPVSVSPTTTTIYTLTVTPTVGTAITQTVTVFIQSTVSVNESISGPTITDQLMGINMAVWDDFTNGGTYTASNSPILTAFENTGFVALRWPGGSTADDYHWNSTNTSNPANGVAPTASTCGSSTDPNTNYLNFINDLEFPNPAFTNLPNGFDVALTADYGTSPNCTGAGVPSEAANWVQYAYANGGTVSHVTVGNEEYGSWEADNHTPAHNGATYAAAVGNATSNGYYESIKNACSGCQNTLVGVDVEPNYAPWDEDVMSGSTYDFVEYHFYPQNPGNENDTNLIHSDAQELTTNINTIKAELTKWGTNPTAPIYVGEMGSVSSNPGKQTWSITQGLYAGQLLGEMMNDGVVRATWWIGFGNCNGSAGNNSSSLYGWQDFGAYNIFSDGPSDGTCPDAGAIGTMSPTARAYELFSNVAVNGESVLTATVGGDTYNVRAYAATNSGGTALVLFNLNENANAPVTITLSGIASANTVTVETYDKAIYDMSNPATTDTWAPPVTTSLGAQTLPLTLSLAPWSMNVVMIH